MRQPTPHMPAGSWTEPRGFIIDTGLTDQQSVDHVHAQLTALFERLHVSVHIAPVDASRADPVPVAGPYRLTAEAFSALTPDFNTMDVASRLGWSTLPNDADVSDNEILATEIILALLASPMLIRFPSLDEFHSAIDVRRFMIEAGRHTSMEFHTELVDRPPEFWNYSEESGFTLKPGCSLIEALQITTQPRRSGRLYGFSCYRATEYVILLGMAQEAQRHHPALLKALENQWHTKAVASGRFHEAFLQEIGSNEVPLPMGWYVPGDRVWFRNPDSVSSDIAGFEGSWVIYLGQGLFANFWKPDQPFDLIGKCLEIFFWRDGAVHDPDGALRMDESIVEARVNESRAQPDATQGIVQQMLRLRDLQGIYAQGGCMDNTREWPRWLRPGTCDIRLPGA
jgi:hypothetical protein